MKTMYQQPQSTLLQVAGENIMDGGMNLNNTSAPGEQLAPSRATRGFTIKPIRL